MADLKIKATSGNLVLADDGGDAAITVASNGTTTFAENATLSGTANNLGTVTAGSIAGGAITSATTFPVGHIIQTTTNTRGTTTTNLVSASDWTDTVVTASITTSSATNSVIMHYSCSYYHNNTSGDFGAGFRVKKVHSGGTSYPESLAEHDSSQSSAHSSIYTISAGGRADRVTGSHIDDACGYEGLITYTLQGDVYNADAAYTVGSGGMNANWHVWFQEVKR